MNDFTKATQMTDARGNVVPVEFVEKFERRMDEISCASSALYHQRQ